MTEPLILIREYFHRHFTHVLMVANAHVLLSTPSSRTHICRIITFRGNRAENVNLFDRRRDERFTKHRGIRYWRSKPTIESREELNSSYGGRGNLSMVLISFAPGPSPPSRREKTEIILAVLSWILMTSLPCVASAGNFCLVLLLFFVSGTPVNTERRE